MRFLSEIIEVREHPERGCIIFPGVFSDSGIEVGSNITIVKPSGEKIRTQIHAFEHEIQLLLGPSPTPYVPFSIPPGVPREQLTIGSRIYLQESANAVASGQLSRMKELEVTPWLLPAIFIGRVGESAKLSADFRWSEESRNIVQIHHRCGGLSVQWADGVGILIPLGTSPFNGPIVDILRIFGSRAASYFGINDPGLTNVQIEAMERFLRKYPHLQAMSAEIQADISQAGISGTHGMPYYDAERLALNNLLARIANLPPLIDGSLEGLGHFEKSVEDLVSGWLSCSVFDFANLCEIHPDDFTRLRSAIGGAPLKSYLLWENCD